MTDTTRRQVRSVFSKLEAGLNGLYKSKFHQERKEAIDLFYEVGFPHKKHEEYKYLNLNKILADDYELSGYEDVGHVSLDDFNIPALDAYQLVFVDGFLSRDLSSDIPEEDGILLTSLASAQIEHKDLLNKIYTSYKDKISNPFALLNTAMARDGAFVYLSRNKELDKPVHIIHINSGSHPDKWVQPTHVIALDDNAHIDVLQSFFSSDKYCKENTATYVNAGRDAQLNIYTHQDLGENTSHFNTLYGKAYGNSNISTYTYTQKGGLVRNNVHISLEGEHSDCHMYGLYVPKDREIIDNHTLVDHKVPFCESNEMYNGVLLDRSKATFNGKIFVHQDAQRTNAYQSNKNLVVSDHAQVNTKPQLEIWADDVKCTHGATVGQLNDTELFYMKSRGIPEAQAKALLTYAFAGSVIQNFKLEEYKKFCRESLADKLEFEGLDNFI